MQATKHPNMVADGCEVIVTEKQDPTTSADNRAGLSVMLASEDIDWRTVMTAYGARRLTELKY
ncbi:hypothetical protein PAA26_00455 [Methanomassiliicoccaceae archaeon COG_1]|nr:hypothetical protein [Methanomassiliicoccaceae archaeon COG_1]